MKNTKIQKGVQNFRIYIYPFNLYSLFIFFFSWKSEKSIYMHVYLYYYDKKAHKMVEWKKGIHLLHHLQGNLLRQQFTSGNVFPNRQYMP